eukprot:NODE_1213_length_1637_cov_31.637909_g1078_i0.p1 GENE.NODE_1213_length_1637_cov_31.637909_g1078_i0~~NODE_1213_length_1637_cov_31.637909_g1078_i0.p1  ORF type:complete len:524 (-),score=91.01 NODE_1213_length_1637_cov_31.637909_g1078_i0:66-1520(-)
MSTSREALALVSRIEVSSPEDAGIVAECCFELARLKRLRSLLPDVAVAVVTVVTLMMRRCGEVEDVEVAGTLLLGNMACNCPSNRALILSADGIQLILEAMRRFVESSRVQQNACHALANLCSVETDEATRQRILSQGPVAAIRRSAERHRDCELVQENAKWAIDNLTFFGIFSPPVEDSLCEEAWAPASVRRQTVAESRTPPPATSTDMSLSIAETSPLPAVVDEEAFALLDARLSSSGMVVGELATFTPDDVEELLSDVWKCEDASERLSLQRTIQRVRESATAKPSLEVANVAESASCPPPSSFCCPITQQVMEDPVFTADGHTFERSAIEQYFNSQTITNSPVTGLPLVSAALVPNHALRGQILAWKQNPERVSDSTHVELPTVCVRTVHEKAPPPRASTCAKNPSLTSLRCHYAVSRGNRLSSSHLRRSGSLSHSLSSSHHLGSSPDVRRRRVETPLLRTRIPPQLSGLLRQTRPVSRP